MPLSHLEHILVQTADIEKTRDWYVRVLGMTVGPSPDFKFPVCWLYVGEHDVIHVTQGGADTTANRKAYLGQQSAAISGSGVIDHIGFRCTGLRETMQHLNALSVAFKERQVDDQSLYQLFLFDPNGIKIELNFPSAEAQGMQAEVIASKLSG